MDNITAIVKELRESNRERAEDALETNINLEKLITTVSNDGGSTIKSINNLAANVFSGMNALAASIDSLELKVPEIVPPTIDTPTIEIPDPEPAEPIPVELQTPENPNEADSIVQEDPNVEPSWVDSVLGQLKENQVLQKIGLDNLADKVLVFGQSISDFVSSNPVTDAAKGFIDTLMSIGKTVLMVMGGFTALQGFTEGWEKATEWFGENANFGDKLAAGITGILQAFGFLENEEKAKEFAEKLSGFFEWVGEKINWMFEGVEKVFSGITTFLDELFGITTEDSVLAKFKDGKWIEGISQLISSFIDNVIGEFNLGAAAAFAIFFPKFTAGLAKTLATNLAGPVTTAISYVGASLTTAFSTIASTAGAALSSLLAPITAALGIGLAPLAAIVAGVVLVLKGLYDGIKAGIDMFNETGSILESIKTGLATMFGSIVGFIPNLLKDIVSWVASKLGFENFSNKLDSFDFAEMITDAMVGVFDWFEDKVANLKLMLYKAIDKLPFVDMSEQIAELEENKVKREELRKQRDEVIAKRREEKDEPAEDITPKEETAEPVQVQYEAITPKEETADSPILETRETESGPGKLETRETESELGKLKTRETESELGKLETRETDEPTLTKEVTTEIEANHKENYKLYREALDRNSEAIMAMKNKVGSVNVINNANASTVVNKSTPVISNTFSNNNIGNARGLFGAPVNPLSSSF